MIFFFQRKPTSITLAILSYVHTLFPHEDDFGSELFFDKLARFK